MSGSYATQDPCLIALYGTNSTKHGQHSEGARVKGKIVRKVPPERPRIFSGRVICLALVRVDQFYLHLGSRTSLGPFSSAISSIRDHYSQGETMGIAGYRICRGSCRAGGMRAPVRNNCGHTDWTDSSGRVFHTALLVANLRYRPNW